jgi:hypothetical protein
MTCANCTLQVIEFMSNHPLNAPGGRFYHYCATVAISATGADASTGGKSGCSSGSGANETGIGRAMLGRLLARRRRSRQSCKQGAFAPGVPG